MIMLIVPESLFVLIVGQEWKDKRVKYCSAACEKQYWREKSKQDAAYKKRSREKTIGMRNYSKKEMAIKLYKEKKEAEEFDWKERGKNE